MSKCKNCNWNYKTQGFVDFVPCSKHRKELGVIETGCASYECRFFEQIFKVDDIAYVKDEFWKIKSDKFPLTIAADMKTMTGNGLKIQKVDKNFITINGWVFLSSWLTHKKLNSIFKAGDTVYIKDKFWEIIPARDAGITTNMKDLSGKSFKILKTPSFGTCFIYGLGWSWSQEWLTKEKEKGRRKMSDCSNCRLKEDYNPRGLYCRKYLEEMGVKPHGSCNALASGEASNCEPKFISGGTAHIKYDFWKIKPKNPSKVVGGMPDITKEMKDMAGKLVFIDKPFDRLSDVIEVGNYSWLSVWLTTNKNNIGTATTNSRKTTTRASKKTEPSQKMEKKNMNELMNQQIAQNKTGVLTAFEVTKGDLAIQILKKAVKPFCTKKMKKFLSKPEGEYILAQIGALLLNATSGMHSKPIVANNIATCLITSASVKEANNLDIEGLVVGLAGKLGLESLPLLGKSKD